MELLLSVEDCFMIAGQGLVLAPDLPLPQSKQSLVCAVIVERPDGTRLPAEAELRLDHFRTSGYKSIVHLLGLDRADVPVGSKVWKV